MFSIKSVRILGKDEADEELLSFLLSSLSPLYTGGWFAFWIVFAWSSFSSVAILKRILSIHSNSSLEKYSRARFHDSLSSTTVAINIILASLVKIGRVAVVAAAIALLPSNAFFGYTGRSL